MKQQTALQTLISWGDEMLLKHPQKILSFGEAIDKAVELLKMEKEQIETAWRNGDNDSMYSPKELDQQAEQYYNETYGKAE